VACAVGAAACLAMVAPAGAAERLDVVQTPPGPGPAQYNQVEVHKFGPAGAKRVLVLLPGTQGGAGDFTLDARHLVKSVKNLQVWAVDRRSQALEDTSMFERADRGEVSLQQMFDYYLGWLDGATPPSQYHFLDASQYGFAREWGMEVALNDARAVVLAARKHGRRQVVLGGHSLGASLTAAYAAWDFNGRPGYKDIDGMVLIDGGLLGSFDSFDLAQAQQQIASLSNGNPFLDLLGLGIPEIAGLFAEIGGIYAERAPAEPATTLQGFSLLPPAFNPPFPVTNRGLLGNAFDRDTSPASLALLHMNGGGFAASGNPRDWLDIGGVTPVARLAATFGQEPSNAVEWFFPKRLTIDTNGANDMRPNDVAQFLGLRLFHTKQVDVPLYSIQTDLTHGGVLAGSREFIHRARTTRSESVLVNADPEQSHLDPLLAAWKQNAFFRTVVPFLKDKVFHDRDPNPAKKKKGRRDN
jgi:pimeloyl-ACP methyl ester carboxylesterase